LSELEIVEVNHGVANNFGSHIEINENLKKYPHLRQAILNHELAHTNKKVSAEDFKLDFMISQSFHYGQLFKFMITHPRSLTQLLPFYYSREKGIVYDVNMIVMYLMMGFVFGGTIYLGGRYL